MLRKDAFTAIVACLCATELNVASSLLSAPLGPKDPATLVALLGVSLGAISVLFAALWVAFETWVRIGGCGEAPLGAATATLVLALAYPLLPRTMGGIDRVSLVLAGSLALTAGTFAAHAIRGRGLRHAPAFAAAAIVTSTGALAWSWVRAYLIPAESHGSGLTWALGLFTLLGIAWLMIYRLRRRMGAPQVVILVVGLGGLLGVAALLVALHRTVRPEWRTEHPRQLILITVDTLRADAVGAYGSGRADTPRIDEFTADATVFRVARSPAPWTKPAITSVLTGLSPSAHGAVATDSALPTGATTVAERLRAAGYRTAAFVANPHLGPEFSFDRGFDEYHTIPGPDLGLSLGAMLLRRLSPRGPDSSRLTDLALHWVAERAEEPFFLWLHYLDPHLPYAPPRAWLEGVDTSAIGESFGDLEGARMGHAMLSKARKAAIRDLYRAEVRYVDQEVGRVLDELRDRNLYGEALVVIASDHGEEFWEHGNFEHGHSLYEELLRVPLILKEPGSIRGRRCGASVDRPVSIGSISATLLEEVGLSLEEGTTSYPSLLRACEATDNDTVGADVSTGTIYYEPRIAVVFDGMKYVHGLGTNQEELFLLESDAAEASSAARECPACLERGRRLIREHVVEAERLRDRLGLSKDSVELSPETREQLRALGYLE